MPMPPAAASVSRRRKPCHRVRSWSSISICRRYGLYWSDMNVCKRGTVVIGRDGEVRWSEVREPSNAMDFDAVLAHLA